MNNKKILPSVLLGVGLVCMVVVLSSFVLSVNARRLPNDYAHWDEKSIPISLQCAACHPAQFKAWCGSDHAWALRRQTAELDDEPFSGRMLRAHGVTQRFTTGENGQRLLEDSAAGRKFPTSFVVGHTPLVQYLVPGERGAFHTPSAAWDTEKREWFDIFADDARLRASGMDKRLPGEWGHWLGRGMNFNSQCARCHTSGFSKNYNPDTDTYNSAWKEPGVSCIQCHRLAAAPDPGDGCLVAPKHRRMTAKQVSDNCASCHARAEELDDAFRPCDRFEDHFRLELPVAAGVYWPNGMQRDEVYCETGFRLSRMAKAGVTCVDCHRRENGELILPYEDNSLCYRCHETGLTEIHGTRAPISHGAPDNTCDKNSIGGRCVECHMPDSVYMGRDSRRDHSLNIPDPALSVELGIPNSCTMCHKDKDDAWAAEVLARAIPRQKMEERRPRTRAVHAAQMGKGNTDDLLTVLEKEDIPAWRATLLELLAHQPHDRRIVDAAGALSADPDPLVRTAAAGIMGDHVARLLEDDARAVRHVAAWTLLHHDFARLAGTKALAEIKAAALHRADQPTGAMQLASIALAEGDTSEAERQYKRAIEMDPVSPVPYMDYAVLLARLKRPMEALQQMLSCTRRVPDHAEAQYRLALILAEVGQYRAALVALERALKADPHHSAALEARKTLQNYLRVNSPKF